MEGLSKIKFSTDVLYSMSNSQCRLPVNESKVKIEGLTKLKHNMRNN